MKPEAPTTPPGTRPEPPDFDLTSLELFGGKLDEIEIESQFAALPHIDQDQRYEDPPTIERIFRTEQHQTAKQTLDPLPNERQAIHLVIGGRFALWDFVPAILALAGCPIEQLHLATLGFSKKNIAELTALLDAKQIERVALLCSHYFLGTSGGIYELARDQLAERGQRFASCRTHAKLALAKLTDGRTVSIESSANLRSCKNIEQVVIGGDPQLYKFHTTWIDSLFPCKPTEPPSPPISSNSPTKPSKSGKHSRTSTESPLPTSHTSPTSATASPAGTRSRSKPRKPADP